jgi:hypothetical protein
VFFFDVQPDAIGDHMLAEDQDATDLLMASDVRVNRWIFQLGDRVHGRAPFGLLRVIDDQREGFPRRRMQSPQPLLRLLAKGRLGIPPLHQEEVVETGPVRLGIQIPVEVGNVPPTPREGHYQDQQAKIFVVVPMKSGAQGAKELV